MREGGEAEKESPRPLSREICMPGDASYEREMPPGVNGGEVGEGEGAA